MREVGEGHSVFWEMCGNPEGEEVDPTFTYARRSWDDDAGVPADGGA